MKTRMRGLLWLPVMTAAVLGVRVALPSAEMDLMYFVERLTDLDRLVDLKGGEISIQCSSYDRASKLGPNLEKIHWDANGDAGQYIRTEPNGEAVMAELSGPGVISQTWSANPQGKLHFYLDGAAAPMVFDFTAFTTGTIPEIPPPISGKGGGAGCNCYLPIPFAKSCVIKADKAHGQYYHFDATRYPEGTPVKTFTWPLSADEKASVAKAAKWLSERCGEDPAGERAGSRTESKEVVVPAGGKATLAEIQGPAMVTALRAKLEGSGKFPRRAVLLRAYWDGEEKPSIDSPYGDFFASTWADIPFRSLPVGMTEKGGYSFWRMPFSKSARFEAVNDGASEARIRFEAVVAPFEWTPTTGYFHAKWRREAPNVTFDWPYLRCEGRGRFVGVAMSVYNPDPPWFGEGDEKVTVDGEVFPSWFGTGTEDYFCDAWGFRKFIQPQHGCPIYTEPGNTTVYRWHILDDIPFTKSFEITIENYGNNKDYSSVAYWYALPPNRDFFTPTPVKDRMPWPKRIANAIEAESVALAGAAVVDDEGAPEELSGGKAVKIEPGASETALSIGVEAKDAYRIVLFGPKGQKGGGLKLRIGDETLLEAAPPAFGDTGRIEIRPRMVLERGKVELGLSARGGPVILDALSLVPSPHVEGLIEAEGLEHRASARARAEPRYVLEGDATSGCAYLSFASRRAGESVELILPAELSGLHVLSVRIIREPTGGSFVVSVGGMELPQRFDTHAEKDSPPEEELLGTVQLPGARNVLKLTLEKPAEGARGGTLALDGIRLKRILVPGAIETESLKILAQDRANAQVQMLGPAWSAEGQLFCPGQKDESVDLELPVKEAGKYALDIYFTKAADYGIVEVELDGKALGEKFNGFNNGVAPSGKVAFGAVELSAGNHKLTFRCREKDPNSSNFFMGIDCLTLAPVR